MRVLHTNPLRDIDVLRSALITVTQRAPHGGILLHSRTFHGLGTVGLVDLLGVASAGEHVPEPLASGLDRMAGSSTTA